MNMSDIEKLCEEHGSYIYGFCLRLTNNTYNAEELYQDTFLKALEKAASIDKDNNPKAYLAAVAVSLWKSHKRKFARRHAIAPTVLLEEQGNLAHEAFTDDALMQKELYKEINAAVNALDEKLRLPVLLYYTAEMPLCEIAHIMKCPEGTVKSRLYNARTIIREKLEVYENEG